MDTGPLNQFMQRIKRMKRKMQSVSDSSFTPTIHLANSRQSLTIEQVGLTSYENSVKLTHGRLQRWRKLTNRGNPDTGGPSHKMLGPPVSGSSDRACANKREYHDNYRYSHSRSPEEGRSHWPRRFEAGYGQHFGARPQEAHNHL
ncbi:MAG: hypothetical protein Q8O35_01805 [Humidesulfovibrio sp.]|uniref:hypothetical protein n=1 Tax=Humidesulfovibrio sp. TaxID=2910988 RepID=UPI0027331A8F|nr:hypothetical protein [Humidesulfovibrio sp.]MDP2846908.1 hypothetical protein [Humidesulfovibrio sp.]